MASRLPAPILMLTLVLSFPPTRAWGQDPAPAPVNSLAAGGLVTRAVIEPFPVRFTRGDSARVQVTLVDSVGATVTGATWRLETAGDVVTHRAAAGEPGGVIFSGAAPGEQLFRIVVNRGPGDAAVAHAVDSLMVTVTDWAVARIEIEDLGYEAYAGTTIRLRAKVITDHGTEHEHAHVAWRTDDPCFARVMPDGVITFGEATKVTVVARAEGVSAKKQISIANNPVRTIEISPRSVQTRAGDVVNFRVAVMDRRGVDLDRVALSYGVSTLDTGRATIDTAGYFVAEQPGTYIVRVSAGAVATEAVVEAGRRPPAAPVRLEGRGVIRSRPSRGLWVFTGKDGRDYAYTGTADSSGAARVYAWDVTDPGHVTLSDSVALGAGAAGDVKVNGDGSWAVVTREPAPGQRGGVTILDLTVPGHPTVMAEFGDAIAVGARGAWILSPLPYVLVADAAGGLLHVLDLSDPRQPRYAAVWELRKGAGELHGIWSDGKHAYLAHGTDGLVILDVGDEGTPASPMLVSQLAWPGAAAVAVARGGRYVYVAESVPDCATCVGGPRGGVRVIDVQKIKEPRAVARFDVPEAGASHVWVESSVLYVSALHGGLRVVDVTGELRDDLYRQGRQSGWMMTRAGADASPLPDTPEALTAMPFKGRIFVTDGHSGLWVGSHQLAARIAR